MFDTVGGETFSALSISKTKSSSSSWSSTGPNQGREADLQAKISALPISPCHESCRTAQSEVEWAAARDVAICSWLTLN